MQEYIEIPYNEIYLTYTTVIGRLMDELQKSPKKKEQNETTIKPELPVIKVPEFTGNMTEWITFIELFTQVIHNNDNITDAVKMQYLKTYVKGDAARLINHLNPTSENYGTAYKILVSRYDNTRALLGKLIDNIIEIMNHAKD